MSSKTISAIAPVSFDFQSNSIRTIADDKGNPWFLANDVCAVLGYANPRDAIAKHCREGGVAKRDTPTESGIQAITFIDEGNLYRLIIKSRKSEAEPFERWVCDEVLPTIRKTGQYTAPQYALKDLKRRQAFPGCLSLQQQDALKETVNLRTSHLPIEKQGIARIKLWSAVKSKFGTASYKLLTPDQLPAALDLVARADLEGEYLPKAEATRAATYSAPLTLWKLGNRIGGNGWLTYPELVRMESQCRPLAQLLSQLTQDGHDIEGAQAEYSGIKLLLENYHWQLHTIAGLLNQVERHGLNISQH